MILAEVLCRKKPKGAISLDRSPDLPAELLAHKVWRRQVAAERRLCLQRFMAEE